MMTYPWQEKQWQQVRLAVEQQRLPHAVLLAGAEGTGIGQFAIEFVRYLLCDTPVQPGSGCGQCRSCLLFSAGSHPDIRIIHPEDTGMQIKVDAIRELIEYFHLSSQYGKYKIAVIEPAEGMNRHSANGLLKTLEEPPALSLLILVSYQPAKLPITIRSRCQKITFSQVNRQLAFDWLNERIDDPERAAELLDLAGGAPLKALALSETDILQQQQEMLTDLRAGWTSNSDPVKLAEKWQKFDVSEVMRWLLFLFSEMAALRCAAKVETADKSRINKELRLLSDKLDLSQITGCYDLVLKNYHLLTGEINLNKQGLLEEIIVHWQFLSAENEAK